MAQIRIPCLVGKTNKAGITSWYWQPSKTLATAGWKPISLGKSLEQAMRAAQARNAEVDQWKLGEQRPEGVAVKVKVGTFASLIEKYRKERLEGKDASGRPLLKPNTIKTYKPSLRRLEEWAGKHPIAYVTPARVTALRKAVARPIKDGGLGHAGAHHLLKTLRVVMAFAESEDIIAKGSNPATNFGLGAPPSRKTIWTPEDDAAFDAAAYDLGLPSMALARELALFTAQRESDLIRFTEGQLTELDIFERTTRELLAGPDGKVMGWTFAQEKTSDADMDVWMEIPLEPKILEKVQAALRKNRARDRAAEPRRLLSYVIVDEDNDGIPFNERRFIRRWNKVIDHAVKMTGRKSMNDLVWHDLRRTRVVRLRRRKMPKEMIASITGHSLAAIEAMLKVYGPIDPTITAAAIASSLIGTSEEEEMSA
jgi:integrase